MPLRKVSGAPNAVAGVARLRETAHPLHRRFQPVRAGGRRVPALTKPTCATRVCAVSNPGSSSCARRQVAQEQQPRHEQHERNRHLPDHQHVAHRPATAGNVRLLPLERRHLRALRRLQRRRSGTRGTSSTRTRQHRVQQQPAVEVGVNLERQRQRQRHAARCRPMSDLHQQESPGRAQQRRSRTLRSAAVARACAGSRRARRGRPSRDCAPPPRQQQAGDVGAGDGEDEADGDEQHGKESARPSRDCRTARSSRQARTARCLPNVSCPAQCDRERACPQRPSPPGPRQRSALVQPADELHGAAVAERVEVRHQRPTERQVDFRRQRRTRPSSCNRSAAPRSP